MIKKISLPTILVLAALWLAAVLSALLAAHLSARSIFWMLPIFLFAYLWGRHTGDSFGLFILFSVPLSGIFATFMAMKVVPFFLPVYLFGFVGLCSGIYRRGQKYLTIEANIFFFLFALAVSCSFVRAVVSFVPFFPHLRSAVSHSPWGNVELGNALGWVLLAGLTYVLAFCVYLYAGYFSKQRMSERLPRILLASMFIPTVFGVIQYARWINWSLNPNFIAQYNSTFTSPNSLGIYTAFVFSFWVALVRRPRAGWKWISGSLILLFLLFIAASRSAFLMVGMTLAISLLVSLFQKKIVPIILVAFLMLAASVFYVRQNNIQREYSRTQVFVQQLKTLCKTGDVSSLIGDREMLWKAGRVTFEHNFVLGTGLGTYLIRMPNYESEIGTISNDNCAQMFLHIGAEMGIVGLVFFVLLLITTFWRAFPSDGPVLLSLVSFVPTFFFGAHLLSFEVNILFWILLGMLSNTNIGPHEYNERN